MDEVPGWVARKHCAEKFGRQTAPLPNRHRARCAECSGMRIRRGDVLANRKNPRRPGTSAEQVIVRRLRTILDSVRESEVRIVTQRVEGHDNVLHLDAVHANETPPNPVDGVPVLAAA